MTVELLPCPFCGAPGELEEVAGSGHGWLACCTRDPTCGSLLQHSKEEAAEAWNTRAISDEARELVERLRPALEAAWTDFLDANPDDVTSPEEYPDHALVTFEQLLDLIERALLSRNSAVDGETSASVTEWVNGAFGVTDNEFRRVARGNEEMAELITAVASDETSEKIGEEAADVAILLHLICGRRGLDLNAEIVRKMQKNRGREWRVDPTGCGYHVERGVA